MKKLIKKFKKLKPELKVKYKPKYHASVYVYNKGGLISVLEPYRFRQLVESFN